MAGFESFSCERDRLEHVGWHGELRYRDYLLRFLEGQQSEPRTQQQAMSTSSPSRTFMLLRDVGIPTNGSPSPRFLNKRLLQAGCQEELPPKDLNLD